MNAGHANPLHLVLGLGESGFATAVWLAGRGKALRVADSRAEPPNAGDLARRIPGVDLRTGPFDASLLEGVSALVISPGLPRQEAVVQQALARGIPLLGEVEVFAGALRELQEQPAPVIAITGTNGKTTVTTMVGAMCSAAAVDTAVAGNISPAALAELATRQAAGGLPACWALELSSFQLETTATLNPVAATVLNVSDDHLDRYAGLDDYAATKARIFQGDGVQVLNRADRRVMAMARPGRRQVTFGVDVPPTDADYGLVAHHGERWLAGEGRPLMRVADLGVAGLHNVANALAALALVRALALPFEPLLGALREFRGLPHRVQPVAEIDGVRYLDDSKGTNVGATVAALEGMGCPTVLIAGGDGKGQDFSPLRAAAERHARAVVVIGRDGPAIAAAIGNAVLPVLHAASMEDAVTLAARSARRGDAVLLSPACASFDMFRNYAHRAEVYCAAVASLKAAAATNGVTA